MTEIILCPGEDGILEELGRRGEIYIYPSHAEKGVMSGFGIMCDKSLKSSLAELDIGIFKFYAGIGENIPFIFLGSTFYRKEFKDVFGLKSFVIRDGAVVYYTKSTYNQNTEIENYHVEVKNGRHEYFDEHIGELNPLYHLIYLSQSGWRKEAYKDALKVCIKEGFLTDWNGIDKLNFNEMELLSLELEKESEFNISNAKVLQKWLNRAVNDLARSHIELFRDLCMIAISSDSESSLKVFKNFYNAITEKVTREKITRKEFPANMIIKDIEIQFRLSLPEDKEEMIFNFLKNEFKDVRIVYAPEVKSGRGDTGLAKNMLHRFSITVKFNKEYHEMEMITWIDAVIDSLAKSVREIDAARHISKEMMWVKKIWIEITAPLYFREKVFEALAKTGWMIVSWDERKFKEEVWALKIEVWCDYPIYKMKSRKELDHIMRSDFQGFDEELDEKLYDLVFPTSFIMDCSRFFVSFYERLSHEDVLII